MVTKVVFTAVDDLNVPSKCNVMFDGQIACSDDELKDKILSRISCVKNIQILSTEYDENYRV